LKIAIVLASYIPSPDKLLVGSEIIDHIAKNFISYDLFVGCNPSTPEWYYLLEKYSKNISLKWAITPTDNVIDSDASAYQTALKLLKDRSKQIEYDYVWFIHTKGSTSNQHEFRKELCHHFLEKPYDTIRKFDLDSNIGLIGNWLRFQHEITGHSSSCISLVNKTINQILPTRSSYDFFGIYPLYSWYIFKGEIIKSFIDDAQDNFFTENLLSEYDADRYFFERDFPSIVNKYGLTIETISQFEHPSITPNLLKKLNRLWLNNNYQSPNKNAYLLFFFLNRPYYFLKMIFNKMNAFKRVIKRSVKYFVNNRTGKD